MAQFGGFDHNAQALRIVTRLERRYAAYDGLNLTWETLEGLVKHNGPLKDATGAPTARYARARRAAGDPRIRRAAGSRPFELTPLGKRRRRRSPTTSPTTPTTSTTDCARASLPSRTFARCPFLDALLGEIDRQYPGLETSRRIHELTRRVITRFVEDAIAEGDRRIAALAPQKADDIRNAGGPVISFSEPIREADASIKNFLYPHMYRHPKVMEVRAQADDILRDLFRCLKAEPQWLPEEWRTDLPVGDEQRIARRVADYIAGMTDRYAVLEHRRLFDATPDLR